MPKLSRAADSSGPPDKNLGKIFAVAAKNHSATSRCQSTSAAAIARYFSCHGDRRKHGFSQAGDDRFKLFLREESKVLTVREVYVRDVQDVVGVCVLAWSSFALSVQMSVLFSFLENGPFGHLLSLFLSLILISRDCGFDVFDLLKDV